MFNHNCTACPLHMLACTVCVPGKGPIPCDLMLVGMNPGALEDARGESFIGPAGEQLSQALEAAGISDAYITNAAKCFSGKRKPTRAELSTCADLYLVEEIKAVKPKLIVALGDLSLLTLTNRSGVGRSRGQLFELRPGLGGGVPVMCSYHPAAYLHSHDIKVKEALVADLQAAKRFLDGQSTSIAIEYDAGVLECDTVAVDVETVDGVLTLGSISDGKRTFVFTADQVLSVFDRLKARRLVAWNARFDLQVLQRHGVNIDKFEFSDPMLMLHLLDSGRQGRYGLEQAVIDTFGQADPAWLASKRKVHGGEEISHDDLVRYCATDALLTFRLYEKFRLEIMADPALAALYVSLVIPAARLLMDVESTPVPLDEEYLRKLDGDFTQELEKLEVEMAEIAGTPDVPNFRSNKVLAKIMYEKLRLPIVAVTDGGAPSTNKTALMELKKLSPFADKLIHYRHTNKMQSSYVRRWLNILETKPYHAHYLQHGTVTGRLSGDFQQTPRPVKDVAGIDLEPNIRDSVIAPPGYVLMEADHSMLELRLAAWYAPETMMLGLLQQGQDVHKYTASRIFLGAEITGFMRSVGKTANFLEIYGGSPDKLAEHLLLHMTEEQVSNLLGLLGAASLSEAAERIHYEWHGTYPGINAWLSRERIEILQSHRAVAPHGRIRWLPKAASSNHKIREEAVREGANHRIQSLATDLTLLGAVLARPRLLEVGATMPWLVHDSLLLIASEEKWKETARILYQAMEGGTLRTAREAWGLDLTVPLEAEVKVGQRWGSLTKLDRTAIL